MRSIATLGALCAALLSLTGCGLVHNAQTGFHDSFRKSFKTSFIDSCSKTSNGLVKACTCIEDQIEKTNTDDQLMKMASDADATQKAFQAAAAKCGIKAEAQ